MPADAKPFPRLPSVPAWDELSAEQRQLAARDMEVYAAMVDYMDEQIERVFDYLKETGEYDNTMIIFFSDNGANGHALQTVYPGQTEANTWPRSTTVWRTAVCRNSFIETGARLVPGQLMAPSRMFKGVYRLRVVSGRRSWSSCREQMSNAGDDESLVLSTYETSCQRFSMSPESSTRQRLRRSSGPVSMHGQFGVGPLVRGERPRLRTLKPVKLATSCLACKAFFDGDWKILWMPPPVGKGEWELFNLRQDPAEINDLSAEHPDRVEAMVAMWEQYKTDNTVLDIAFDLGGMAK